MNTIIRRSLFILLICISIPSLNFAQGFEGTVTWQTSIPMLGDQKIDMAINMKGDKSMTTSDIPNMGMMKTYLDKSAKKIIMVMEAQKQGQEMDLAAIEAAMQGKQFSEPKPTGKKETVKGYSTEEYKSTLDGGMEFDLWVTKDMPKEIATAITGSMESSMQMGGTKNKTFKALFAKGLTPVRINVKKDGDVQATMEFSKAEPRKIDDKEFIIPADIKIQKANPIVQQEDNVSAPQTDSVRKAPSPNIQNSGEVKEEKK
jgi:hypothetical protein